MQIKNKKGQSTVEYVLLVTAVIAVLVVFMVGKGSSLQNQLNSTLCATTDAISTMTDKIGNSHDSMNLDNATAAAAGYSVIATNGTVNGSH